MNEGFRWNYHLFIVESTQRGVGKIESISMRTYHCPKCQFAFWCKTPMQNLGANWSWTWRSLFSTTFSVSLPSSFHQHLPTALLSISLLCLSSSISALLLVQLPSCLFHLSIFTFSSFPLPCLRDPQPSMLLLSMEVNFTRYQVTGGKILSAKDI